VLLISVPVAYDNDKMTKSRRTLYWR